MAEPSLAISPAVQIDDCWRRIGVRGDGSCPRLAEHIHCRNCQVYSHAAVALLDAQTRSEVLHASALGLEEAPAFAQREASLSCLVFRVGDEWLALPTAALGEVTAPCPLHSLPHRRDAAMLGVASVRGNLLPCISLAMLFGAATADDSHDGSGRRFLILDQGRGAIALPVAEVAGMRRVASAALQPLPATLERTSARYTQALFADAGRSVGLLDAALVRQALTRSLA
ncbi:chemotaxis protein CheW [Cupriavidus sp. IDO]|uniref:chemotaxis protein CheW n=1 Tax=Cupriavidus sp. IDO TaxID=1539142 RepID=UPI000578F1FA|nr:chemotaxis protein CheW [Cupriavidus sp. IDO]KWR91524.1 chemotaxis protein CheR [Cupriavidus sp. IDO]